MVVADPAAELLALVTAPGDPPPDAPGAVAAARARLIRRRFDLALPPPFAPPPAADEPVRPATPADAAAVAAVKWRAFGANYRGGVLPDDFLDGRDVVPPVSFWVGRALVPPSRRHRLWVWGRPGAVYGYADVGPEHPDDRDPAGPPGDAVGEVYELYVDPTAQGRGGGTVLLAAAEAWLAGAGFDRAELSTLATNPAAQAFYRARGWRPTGRTIPVDLGTVAFVEVRFGRGLQPVRP